MERNSAEPCKQENGLISALKSLGDVDQSGNHRFDLGKLFSPLPSTCVNQDNFSRKQDGAKAPGSELPFDPSKIYPDCKNDKNLTVEAADACYRMAQDAHRKDLDNYWAGVDKAKSEGRGVKIFPPDYAGPEKPAGYEPVKPLTVNKLASVNEMVEQSRSLNRYATDDNTQSDFKLRQVPEEEFKKSYATETINVGKSLGLTDQEIKKVVMDIYAFECGGRGTHDMLSGVPMGLTKPDAAGSTTNFDHRREMHPKSSAVGYNQIIMSTNLTFADNEAPTVASRLRELAKDSPRKAEIEQKAKLYEDLQVVLHRELSTMANQNKGTKQKYIDDEGKFKYALYADFAKSRTPTSLGVSGRELSTALHALNLDGDVGPVIQSRQLAQVVGHTLSDTNKQKIQYRADQIKTSAEGYDKLDDKVKNKAVDEVFKRAKIKNPDLAASLRTRVDGLVNGEEGASDKLVLKNLTDQERSAMRSAILALRGSHLSPAARGLVDKLHQVGFAGNVAHEYLGAAVELGNLAGSKQADAMLDPAKANLPTVNFFDRKGYEANRIVQRKTAGRLLDSIFLVMHGDNASPNNWGNEQFETAYRSVIK